MEMDKTSAWAGWVYFASVMIFIIGAVQLLTGFVALFKDDFYIHNGTSLVVFDYSQWGWIHMLIGLCLIATGVAIGAGKMWGRIVGTALVALNLVSYVAFLPAYPLWSIMIIIIDVLVIFALTMHGNEVKA